MEISLLASLLVLGRDAFLARASRPGSHSIPVYSLSAVTPIIVVEFVFFIVQTILRRIRWKKELWLLLQYQTVDSQNISSKRLLDTFFEVFADNSPLVLKSHDREVVLCWQVSGFSLNHPSLPFLSFRESTTSSLSSPPQSYLHIYFSPTSHTIQVTSFIPRISIFKRVPQEWSITSICSEAASPQAPSARIPDFKLDIDCCLASYSARSLFWASLSYSMYR